MTSEGRLGGMGATEEMQNWCRDSGRVVNATNEALAEFCCGTNNTTKYPSHLDARNCICGAQLLVVASSCQTVCLSLLSTVLFSS